MTERQIFREISNPEVKVNCRQDVAIGGALAVMISLALLYLSGQAHASMDLPDVRWFIEAPVLVSVRPPEPPPLPREKREVPMPEPDDPSIPPTETPEGIPPEKPETFDRVDSRENTPDIIAGDPRGIPEATPEPPPPPPPAPRAEPVRVGGDVRPPVRTKNVAPIYPSIAQSARVQGVVIIEATIGLDGRVQDAKILRSVPLLDAAALEAVRQWEYTPTTLNGNPVPVVMTVTVQFALN